MSVGSTIEDVLEGRARWCVVVGDSLPALLEGRRAIMVEMDPEIAQTAIRRCEEIDT